MRRARTLILKEENEPNTHVTDTHVMSHVMILNDEIGSHGNQETAELSSFSGDK